MQGLNGGVAALVPRNFSLGPLTRAHPLGSREDLFYCQPGRVHGRTKGGRMAPLVPQRDGTTFLTHTL